MNMNISKLIIIQMVALTGVVGCASTPNPRSMEMAESELAAAKKDDIDTLYPSLVDDADVALKHSRAEVRAGDIESAELHAQIARAKILSARSLVRRQEAQNQMGAMEDSLDSLQGRVDDTVEMAAVAKQFEAMQSEVDEEVMEPVPYPVVSAQGTQTPPKEREVSPVKSHKMMMDHSKPTQSHELHERAQDHVMKVKMARAEAMGRGEDNLCPENFKEAGAVLDIAAEELSAKRYSNAFELAVRAEERLKRCDNGQKYGTVQTTQPKAKPAPVVKAKVAVAPKPEVVDPQKASDLRTENEAIQAISEVQIALGTARLKNPKDARIKEAAILLSQSEEWMDRDQYSRSLALARAAQGLLDSPEQTPPVVPKAPPEEKVRVVTTAAPITTVIQAPEQPNNWQEAYKSVLNALVARDRASEVNSPESNEAFVRGVSFLNRANVAWKSTDYDASQRFAEAAFKDFTQVQTLAKQSKEASVQAKVKELEAREAANRQGKQQTQETDRRAATEALRQVELELTECENCAEQAPEDFQKAQLFFRDAKTEFERGEFTQAQKLANESQHLVKEINNTPWSVTLGPRLTVKDGALDVQPKVDFKTASSSVTPESRGGVEALGTFLRENPRAFVFLEIQGYTDSRGNDEKNRELSQNRANDVLNVLKAAGVNPEKVKAIGYGESNPIASNDTPDGRAANRRVEFRIRWSDGVVLNNQSAPK